MHSSELFTWAKLFAAATWEEVQILAQKSEGHAEDLFRSTTDPAFQRELLEEYHLLDADSKQ